MLLCFALTLVNCEKDDEFVENSLIKNVNIKRVTFNKIKEDKSLKRKLDKIDKRFNNQSKDNISSKINAIDDSFSILTDEILQATTDSTEIYTFRIETPTHSNSEFENFIIEKRNDDEFLFYIYRFKNNNSQEEINYNISRELVTSEQINLDDFADYANLWIGVDDDGCIYEYVYDDGCSCETTTYYGMCFGGGGSSSSGSSSGGFTGNNGGYFDDNNGGYTGGNPNGNGSAGSGGPNSNGYGTTTMGVLPKPKLTMAEQLANFITLTPEQEVWANKTNNEDLVQDIISDFLNDTDTDYPGFELGYPNNWWLDSDFIINSGNFHIDDESPNAKELAWFAIYRNQAILHIENSIVALNKAEELVDSGILTGIVDGKADAFRHAYWNALGAADFGTEIMKIFADAHEWGETGLSVDMDFHNNHEGRIIGNNFNLFSSDSEIANAILQSLYDGILKYINSLGLLVYTNL